jgi:hypothetical protein
METQEKKQQNSGFSSFVSLLCLCSSGYHHFSGVWGYAFIRAHSNTFKFVIKFKVLLTISVSIMVFWFSGNLVTTRRRDKQGHDRL